ERLTEKYIDAVKFLDGKKVVAIGGLVILTAIGFILMYTTPKSFIPTQDDSFATYSLAMPPGASLSRTTDVLRKADSLLKKREDIAGMTTISGYNAIDANTSPAFAVGYINMKPHRERTETRNIEAFMD